MSVLSAERANEAAGYLLELADASRASFEATGDYADAVAVIDYGIAAKRLLEVAEWEVRV